MADSKKPDPTVEEFATWLEPPKAIEILPTYVRQTAINELVRRLRAGLIDAAGTASWRRGGEDYSSSRILIPREWWDGVYGLDIWHHDFWRTGGATVNLRDRTSYSGTVVIELFGIRFEPNGVYEMPGAVRSRLVEIGTVAAPAPEPRRPTRRLAKAKGSPVTDSEVSAWFEALSPEDKALPFRQLYAKAIADHRPRHVLKKLVLPFVDGRPRGRPRKK